MTLEQLLRKEQNGVLMDIQHELDEAIVPATGYAHSYIRKINSMIDKGELCINPTTYRKVYLPTLAKAVHKELARRWTNGNKTMTPLEHLVQYAKAAHKLDNATAVDIAYKLHERLDDLIEELLDEDGWEDRDETV